MAIERGEVAKKQPEPESGGSRAPKGVAVDGQDGAVGRQAAEIRQGAVRLARRLSAERPEDGLSLNRSSVLGHRRALARPVPELAEDATVAEAIEVLRRRRASLAVVRDGAGRLTGIVSLDDLPARYLQPRAAGQPGSFGPSAPAPGGRSDMVERCPDAGPSARCDLQCCRKLLQRDRSPHRPLIRERAERAVAP